MNVSNTADPLVRALAGLPEVEQDAKRAERLRQRCRAALEHSPAEPLPVLEPAVLGVTCATYAWHLAKAALLLSR